MRNVTLISTLHEEHGNCNADNLSEIIESISPDVIFLEALESTYSRYEKQNFTQFGVYHKKLEIKAIQKYSHKKTFTYVPVLESSLTDSFENKFQLFKNSHQHHSLFEKFILKAMKDGFTFLNSIESVKLQEVMRNYERSELQNNEIEQTFNESIDKYENSMLHNIYLFSKKFNFDSAIFMCGVAHRKSIIEKIDVLKSLENASVKWSIFGT